MSNSTRVEVRIHLGVTSHHNPSSYRAIIIRGCYQAECWDGGEKEGERERGEADGKLKASLYIKTKKLCEIDEWAMY